MIKTILKLLDLALKLISFLETRKAERQAADKVELEERRNADRVEARADAIDEAVRAAPDDVIADRLRPYYRD